MSLRRVQTCEQCGASRDLPKDASADVGGWRTLSIGSLEATLCHVCLRVVVESARAAAATRDLSSPPGQTP